MSEQNQVPVEQDNNDTNIKDNEQAIDYKALYEKEKAELEKIKPNYEKLYKETKQAKADRDKAEREKAEKDGEFEKLWKQAQDELENERKEKLALKQSHRQDKLEVVASRVVKDLAEGNNAIILSTFVKEKLDKLADETGLIQDDVLQSVKKDFETNDLFKGLLKGSKASGGDAPGNTSGKALTKEISRADFEKLDQDSRGKFFAGGGKLID